MTLYLQKAKEGNLKFFTLTQKQPYRRILRKRCSENMQQIYRRTPLLNCKEFAYILVIMFWVLQRSLRSWLCLTKVSVSIYSCFNHNICYTYISRTTAHKMKLSMKGSFSKLHLLKKSLMENIIFCAMKILNDW